MDERDEVQERDVALRRRAEAYLADSAPDKTLGDGEDPHRLLHDLHVHQIELELQNEELREAQQDLARSRDRYLELFHSAPVGYLVLNNAGMILQANNTFGQMVGQDPAALMHTPMSRLIQTEDREIFFGRYRPFYSQPRCKRLEVRLISGEERVLYTALQGRRITPPDRILISVTDITEQRQAEQALLRMRNLESIGTLAGGIAHDFNNILTALVGHIEMAKLRAERGEPVRAFLEGALEASFKAKDLAGRLLTFTNGSRPQPQPVMIDRLLQETIASSLNGANITVDLQVADGLGPLTLDEAQIRSAIRNIIDNAKEAMPWGGRLSVTARNVDIQAGNGTPMPPGKYVQIDVHDQGRGILSAHLNKIFDPYFTTKQMGTQKGMGLGLAISHSIIQKHRGSISVRSFEGEGTTVTIHLPWFPQEAYREDAALPTAGESVQVSKRTSRDDDRSL